MILTLKMLEAERACADQLARFRELFGESVDVTPELCESLAEKFDFGWAARHLLSPSALADYQRAKASAEAEYQRVMAAAQAKYQRALASAEAEYLRVTAPAWAEYQSVTGPAWAMASAKAEYQRAKVSAEAEYLRVKAGDCNED